MSKPVLFWISLLFIVAGLTFGWLAYKHGRRDLMVGTATVTDAAYLEKPENSGTKWLKSYSLTERSGRRFESAELAGKVSIASFFYTSCPSECIQQNAKMAELANESKNKDIVFLSISCDPEVDHPARLREYARLFKADEKQWLFLTGNLAYVRRVGAEVYTVPVALRSHTERFILVDKAGKVQGHFNWKEPAQMTALRKQMAELLAQPAPAPAKEQPPGDPPPAEPVAASAADDKTSVATPDSDAP